MSREERERIAARNESWRGAADMDIVNDYKDGRRPFDMEVAEHMLRRLYFITERNNQHRVDAIKRVNARIDELLPSGGLTFNERRSIRNLGTRVRLLILALDEDLRDLGGLAQYSALLAKYAEHYRKHPIAQQARDWLPPGAVSEEASI